MSWADAQAARAARIGLAIGDVVQPTRSACNRHPKLQGVTGRVTGYGRFGPNVRVQLEGQQKAETYPAEYWQVRQ